MITEFAGGDYTVKLTPQEIEFLSTPIDRMNYRIWPQLNVDVKGIPNQQLNLGCSVSSHIIHADNAIDGIFFDRDGDGPIVRVHPANLHDLVEGKDFMVTRYDGYSDKIWILRDDFQPQQMDMGLPGIPVFPYLVYEMRDKYVSQSDIEHLGE